MHNDLLQHDSLTNIRTKAPDNEKQHFHIDTTYVKAILKGTMFMLKKNN